MKIIKHRFVKYIPDELDEMVLYVSMEYRTAVHNCVCGCGNRVVTPLSPTDWKLSYNGKAISLHPSIGNWNFDCRSHYWIKGGIIEMAGNWSDRMISAGRQEDRRLKEHYYQDRGDEVVQNHEVISNPEEAKTEITRSWYDKFLFWRR